MESDSSLQLAFLEISETRHRLPDVQRKSGGVSHYVWICEDCFDKNFRHVRKPYMNSDRDRHVYMMFMTTTTTIVAYYTGISSTDPCEGKTCHLGGTHLILSWFKEWPENSPFFQICQKFVPFFVAA